MITDSYLNIKVAETSRSRLEPHAARSLRKVTGLLPETNDRKLTTGSNNVPNTANS